MAVIPETAPAPASGAPHWRGFLTPWRSPADQPAWARPALLAIAAMAGCLVLVLSCFALAYGLITLGIWSWAAFLIVAGACVLLAGLVVLVVVIKVRGLSGLGRTRKTVQEDFAMLKHTDENPAQPAVEAG